ncbi:MAG: hypothetical protein LUC41_03340, partial [Clostridiales bacterium]|nr:hypothetical protein [Clostridiales bacterium]
MSEFSEECKRLIRKSNTNVYQIAKVSGLDRTTLQKMVQGKRLPSRQFVEEFTDFLIINKGEKDELYRLFQIEKVGRDVYQCRREVEHLLRDFPSIRKNLKENDYQRKISFISGNDDMDIIVKRMVLDVDIIDAIRYIVISAFTRSDNPFIYMDTFENCTYAMQQIIREELSTGKKMTCHQFVRFERRVDNAGDWSFGNIQALHY